MSSFLCDKCGTAIIDTDKGYVTECVHHPLPVDHGPQRRPANIRQIISGQAFVEREIQKADKLPLPQKAIEP
jgi:hypothetical protein